MAFAVNQLANIQRLAASSRASTPARSTRLSVVATATKPEKADKEFAFGINGSTPPFENFDPLGLSNGTSLNRIRLYREAELTHGRVSMVASVGFIVAENFNPFFDGTIKGPAIGHFQQLPSQFWIVVLGLIGLAEFTRLNKGWVSPAEGKGLYFLKDDYEMGDIGWDPLGLKPTEPAAFKKMQQRELNNGRLAMFAIAGEIVQELITGKELFNLEDDGLLNDANCPPGVICNILENSG